MATEEEQERRHEEAQDESVRQSASVLGGNVDKMFEAAAQAQERAFAQQRALDAAKAARAATAAERGEGGAT